MDLQNTANNLITLTKEIDASVSLDDLGAAIDRFSNAVPYQIVHFGVCKIDNTVIRDILYTRNIEGTAISPNGFSDEMKLMVVNEALALMEPYELLHHEFISCPTSKFYQLQKQVTAAGVDGVIIIPYKHENTISIIIIRCGYKDFMAHMNNILPSLFLLISKTFARFPTLAKWPEEFRLTNREAEILQISSVGAREVEIAAQLGLSVNTVRNHVENAKRKLDARNKAHAISIAMRSGEIDAMGSRHGRK